MSAGEPAGQTSRRAAEGAGAQDVPSQAVAAGSWVGSVADRFERLDYLLTLAITIAQDNAAGNSYRASGQ